MSDSIKKGVLLVNLGTPSHATPEAVRAYLEPFLMDPWVLDIPWLMRWCLVHLLILPKRPALAAQAYQKIWGSEGSPLLTHLKALTSAVRTSLPKDWAVQSAMRYGEPSLTLAFEELKTLGVTHLTILPMYPQYSTAATESSIQECQRLADRILPEAKIQWIRSFYDHPKFIEAFVAVGREFLQKVSQGRKIDHYLMSFHGLPERQLRKVNPTQNSCFTQESCCANITDSNQDCYRAQCFRTARLMAEGLGLEPSQYTVCFQSRLGRTPWIKPYTDELYRTLPSRGVKRVAVFCPAFVADCLETLEEVQIRGREEFIRNGGEDLYLIPSLNSALPWVNAVVEMVSSSARIRV